VRVGLVALEGSFYSPPIASAKLNDTPHPDSNLSPRFRTPRFSETTVVLPRTYLGPSRHQHEPKVIDFPCLNETVNLPSSSLSTIYGSRGVGMHLALLLRILSTQIPLAYRSVHNHCHLGGASVCRFLAYSLLTATFLGSAWWISILQTLSDRVSFTT